MVSLLICFGVNVCVHLDKCLARARVLCYDLRDASYSLFEILENFVASLFHCPLWKVWVKRNSIILKD